MWNWSGVNSCGRACLASGSAAQRKEPPGIPSSFQPPAAPRCVLCGGSPWAPRGAAGQAARAAQPLRGRAVTVPRGQEQNLQLGSSPGACPGTMKCAAGEGGTPG